MLGCDKTMIVKWKTSMWECDDLQLCLDAMALWLFSVSFLLMAADDRIENHHGHLATSHLQLDQLLCSSVYKIVNGDPRFVSGKAEARWAWLISVAV